MKKYFLTKDPLTCFLAVIFNILRNSAHKEYIYSVKAIYTIHPSFQVGFDTIISGNGSIVIGENSYIGNNSFITAEPKTAKIIIGKHCSLSHGINIRTQTHVRRKLYSDEIAAPIEGADIIIGNYVWIGANVYISGGVNIGDNVIVGANSVVTHNIPPNTVYGGVPARLIRSKSDYHE